MSEAEDQADFPNVLFFRSDFVSGQTYELVTQNVREALQLARQEGIEQAAKVAEGYTTVYLEAAINIARHIRTLKDGKA